MMPREPMGREASPQLAHGRAPDRSPAGAKEQVMMTLKIVGVFLAIFGALWLFEEFAVP